MGSTSIASNTFNQRFPTDAVVSSRQSVASQKKLKEALSTGANSKKG